MCVCTYRGASALCVDCETSAEGMTEVLDHGAWACHGHCLELDAILHSGMGTCGRDCYLLHLLQFVAHRGTVLGRFSFQKVSDHCERTSSRKSPKVGDWSD